MQNLKTCHHDQFFLSPPPHTHLPRPIESEIPGTYLVVQWLRIHLLMQGHRFDRAAEKAMIKQLTGTDEAAGWRSLSGLQVRSEERRVGKEC